MYACLFKNDLLISCALVCLYEGVRSLGTRVTDSSESGSCGCWGLNLDYFNEQPVLLTA